MGSCPAVCDEERENVSAGAAQQRLLEQLDDTDKQRTCTPIELGIELGPHNRLQTEHAIGLKDDDIRSIGTECRPKVEQRCNASAASPHVRPTRFPPFPVLHAKNLFQSLVTVSTRHMQQFGSKHAARVWVGL